MYRYVFIVQYVRIHTYFEKKYVHNTYEYRCTLKNTDVPCPFHVGQTVRIVYVFVCIRTYCVRISVRIVYVLYVFVRIVRILKHKGKRTKNTYEYVRYVRIRTQIRTQYVQQYVRNTYDTYTSVLYSAIFVFVRIRTY